MTINKSSWHNFHYFNFIVVDEQQTVDMCQVRLISVYDDDDDDDDNDDDDDSYKQLNFIIFLF